MKIRKVITVYTDGSFRKPNYGAWAAFIDMPDDGPITLRGYTFNTTISRMELTGAIEALKYIETPSDIILYTDSQYVVKSINEWIKRWSKNDWKTSTGDVANSDLMKMLLKEMEKHIVVAKHVKGHSGNLYNELCDSIAQSLTKDMQAGNIKNNDDVDMKEVVVA